MSEHEPTEGGWTRPAADNESRARERVERQEWDAAQVYATLHLADLLDRLTTHVAVMGESEPEYDGDGDDGEGERDEPGRRYAESWPTSPTGPRTRSLTSTVPSTRSTSWSKNRSRGPKSRSRGCFG